MVLDVSGVGYLVHIPLTTFNLLGPSGSEGLLHTSLIHKEDRMDLFGFSDMETLKVFELLLSVSGIGPKLALLLLSHMSPKDLIRNIHDQKIDRLKRISGIGPKKAEKILFELKGKVKDFGTEALPSSTDNGQEEDLRMALLSLGYSPQETEKVMQTEDVLAAQSLEEKIRISLKRLSKGM